MAKLLVLSNRDPHTPLVRYVVDHGTGYVPLMEVAHEASVVAEVRHGVININATVTHVMEPERVLPSRY